VSERTAALDDLAFAERFGRWLGDQRGMAVVVEEVEHPSAGYSSVTTLLRAHWDHNGHTEDARLVVRMAPMPAGTFGDYDLVVQQAAQVAAAGAGVPIAAPLQTETDPAWLGAPFTVMPRVDGHIIGDAYPYDKWLAGLGTAGQATLYEHFLETLVAIHSAETATAITSGVPVRDDDAELAYWDDYLQWSADGAPLPELTAALAWCRAHAPARMSTPMVLRWGDVRLGNIVFGDDLRPRAVLDWDMAAVGAPEHDVAWFTMLDYVMTTLGGRRVDGFPDRDSLLTRYEQLAPHALEYVDWYETFALLRSTAILARIGYLTRAAGGEPAMPVAGGPILALLAERTSAS
jgi:aminoglycoside phosphotransferase (APT) family kinase protein